MRIAHYLHVDKRLKSFRMGADISQKEMAAKLELSVPTYSNYENGYSEPPMELIRAGIPVECSTSVNTATRRLVASINIESPQIASLISHWNELNKELESEKIDSDEYNIWIDSLMNSFNIPVENY